jgi:hypothetical protein
VRRLAGREVVVFDKAYVDFAHLHDLDLRGVQWVTRAKDNFRYRSLRNLPVVKGGNIIKNQIVKLTGGAVEAAGPSGAAAKLWDSRRQFYHAWQPANRVAPRL